MTGGRQEGTVHEGRDRFLQDLKAKYRGEWPQFEHVLRDVYVDFLQPGQTAVDVGFNEGLHLVRMAECVGPSGRVIGVEACPPVYELTQTHIRAQHEHLLARVTLHNVAVSDSPGELEFFYSRTHSGLSGLRDRDVLRGQDVECMVVEVSTLDSLVKCPVDFIKIDIEGGEYDALRGGVSLLEARPVVAFEFDRSSPAYFCFAPGDLVSLFTSRGYQIFDLFGHPHRTAEDLMNSPTWNFLAVPAHVEVEVLCAPARRWL